MSWHAIVPFKASGARKSRLAEILSTEQREQLSESMLAHVAAQLRGCGRIARLSLLAPARPAEWPDDWLDDGGRDLNMALDAVRAPRLLVVHADLPRLGIEDIEALLDAAEAPGAALAPDRHGTGTNAVALGRAMHFAFAFGPGSLRLHRAQLPGCAIVARDGLAFDVDTPADLAAL